MQSAKRLLNYTQILAAIGLGVSCFLPFYQSAIGETRYVNEWELFFWHLPVLFILFKLSNRWLKAALCFLSIIGGLLDYFLITFLATYKSTGLIGFDMARISLVMLMLSWLALILISLFSPKSTSA